MNRELDPRFRARLQAWADRPPVRATADVAVRARSPRRSQRRLPRLAWAVAALVLIVAATFGVARRERFETNARTTRAAAPAPAVPAAPETRLLVLELRSGNRLYVDLATARRSS